MSAPAAIPAATLILFRKSGEGPAEHLFVERARAMRFAGGAAVFPGGRVEPGDEALAARFPAWPQHEAAARLAAIRETLEETGIAVAIVGANGRGWQAALAAGAGFAELLDAAGATLDLAALTPWARWCPRGHRPSHSFDTRFYLAAAPPGTDAVVDATENVRVFWASAAEVLAQAAAGQERLIYPTRRNLERLATVPTLAAAIAHAAATPQPVITPVVEPHPDGDLLRIPDGLGYPVTTELLETAFRV